MNLKQLQADASEEFTPSYLASFDSRNDSEVERLSDELTATVNTLIATTAKAIYSDLLENGLPDESNLTFDPRSPAYHIAESEQGGWNEARQHSKDYIQEQLKKLWNTTFVHTAR